MGGGSRRRMGFRPRTLRHVCACVRRVLARHVRDVYRDASLSLEVGETRRSAHVRGRRVARAEEAPSRARRFALGLAARPLTAPCPRLDTAIHMRRTRHGVRVQTSGLPKGTILRLRYSYTES